MVFAGNNKREAEEALQKIVSAKKQKKNDGVAQATQKAKVETKTLKKKKHESSDSDDSSSEEEEVYTDLTCNSHAVFHGLNAFNV